MDLKYTKQALKSLKNIDKTIAKNILTHIEKLQENPTKGKKLKGNLSNYRSERVGDYRIIYEIENNELIIIIVDIRHRKNIYSKI